MTEARLCKHCKAPFEGGAARVYCKKCTWQKRAADEVRANPAHCKRCGVPFPRKQGQQFCSEHSKGNRKRKTDRKQDYDVIGVPYREIGAELGISKTRVQQIEAQALEKVRVALLAIDPGIGEP